MERSIDETYNTNDDYLDEKWKKESIEFYNNLDNINNNK